MTTVLIVEDDAPLRASLAATLRAACFAVEAVPSAEEAEARLMARERAPIDLLIADVRLTGKSGVDLVEALADRDCLPATLVISGAATATEAVRAMQLGVLDYLEKPFSDERLLQSVRTVLRLAGLERRVATLEATRAHPLDRILGTSEPIVALKERLRRVAATEARVLILGESGVGKELVAEALHHGSDRRQQPFLRLNCAALPGTLIESELFGHVAGAFTDAKTQRKGLFEAADGGTLFLDEIGDMDPAIQAKLLRVLEAGTVRRVGDNQERPVNVRVLAATHQKIDEGSGFRRDLYYRLSHVPIDVPPLRERGDDALLLTEHFLAHFADRYGRPKPNLSAWAMDKVLSYDWPGNVRELRSACERLVILSGPDLGEVDLIPDETTTASTAVGASSRTLREARRAFEYRFIRASLVQSDWNFAEAARVLGVRRTYLHSKAKQLGIQRPRDAVS